VIISKKCWNRGGVVGGFPKTWNNPEMLFGKFALSPFQMPHGDFENIAVVYMCSGRSCLLLAQTLQIISLN